MGPRTMSRLACPRESWNTNVILCISLSKHMLYKYMILVLVLVFILCLFLCKRSYFIRTPLTPRLCCNDELLLAEIREHQPGEFISGGVLFQKSGCRYALSQEEAEGASEDDSGPGNTIELDHHATGERFFWKRELKYERRRNGKTAKNPWIGSITKPAHRKVKSTKRLAWRGILCICKRNQVYDSCF